ncbi:GntR family transcriptional regulator [Allosalinactinospora lopnorensis]|uniref:GntR family transcriptional regulator n=1 Tax=Allosalinactinospora lopnorensis TaxID=1352348 RepID=UPI000623EBCD|nr:GntR family transcriptional regulator [Allosalinactinospora lopnorensis]
MRGGESGSRSQAVAAELGVRELILQGQLAPGTRLVETELVKQLGMSRTPVRAALARLADEGLLVPASGGGYAVASFSAQDVHDAIEVRGTLEGMAVRLAAENGLTRSSRRALHECVRDLDAVVDGLDGTDEPFQRYVELNERFHSALVAASDNRVLRTSMDRLAALPFASPSAFVRAQAYLPETLQVIVQAQQQHHDILEAVEDGQGSRAEMLAREHALLASRNLDHVLRHRRALRAVAGGALIEGPRAVERPGSTRSDVPDRRRA